MDWVKCEKWFVHFHAVKHQISSTDHLNSMGAVEVKMLGQSLQKNHPTRWDCISL